MFTFNTDTLLVKFTIMKSTQITGFVLVISLLVFSCAEEKETNNVLPVETSELISDEDTITVKADTTELVIPDQGYNLLEISEIPSSALPYLIDSNLLHSLDEKSKWSENSTLSSDQVKYLSSILLDNETTTYSKYRIESFLKIDSLRTHNQYDEYESNIDIGMMLYAQANTIKNLKIDDKSDLLVWTVSYATYEACPYSSGDVVFGSYFKEGVLQNTTVLGEDSGSADAPYWANTNITSSIQDSSISVQIIESNGGDYDEETDEEIVEETTETFKLSLSSLGFKVIDPK
jgi:hypothetical protein